MSDADHRPPRSPLVPPGGVELHAQDMTATFSADLSLESVQQSLGQIGQWLPVDGEPSQSIGRLVDFNSTGPLRLGYGAWRDLLLGVQFQNGAGDLITAGGKTVKNVAGYDLTKFMVGQRATFGRLVTITTRTYRRPEAALLARFSPSVEKISQLLPSPLKSQWALLTANALHCGYLGDERTIAFYHSRLLEIGALVDDSTLAQDISFRASHWSPRSKLTFRVSVPPNRIEQWTNQAGILDWAADPAFGIIVGAVPLAGRDQLDSATQAVRGSVVVYDHATDPPTVTASAMTPVESAIFNRLKLAFGMSG